MHAKRHMQSLENFVENSCNSSRASHQFLYTLLSILDNPTRLEELGPDKKQLLYMKLLSPPFDQFPGIVYSKVDPYGNSNNLPSNLYQFIRKYFTYVSLSKYVLYYSAPFRPLYGSSKMLPPGCKGIFRDFKTYSECYFTDTDVQPQLFPFAGTNTYLIGVKELRPSIRTELIRTFSPYSAVHFLMRHLEHPPKNKSALQQCINEYLKRYPLSKDIGMRFRDTNEMIAVYQLMLKAALNIIAHYTVSLLADARIQTLQNHL